jgi:outer membrane protein assembly factor BamB
MSEVRKMRWKFIVFLIWVFCCSATNTHDWPMFQHDTQHTGYSPSTMPEPLQKMWVYKEYGKLGGYIVVSGERIFAVQDLYISSLDITTGSVLWSSRVSQLPHFPAAAHNNVYASTSGSILCLDADTGETRWKYKVGSTDLYCSPLVVDRYVIVGTGGRTQGPGWDYGRRVLCLNGETGDVVWEFYAHKDIYFSPAYSDSRVYANDGKNIYCLDEQTGALTWERETEWTNFSSLSLNENRIFVGTHKGVACLDGETGDILWHFECDSRIFTTPAVAYNKIFIGSPDGEFYCLNTCTGEFIWKIQTENAISTSIVVADKKVVFGTVKGVIYIVKAESGKICESYQLGDSGISALVLSNGKLIVGQDTGVITCFESTESPYKKVTLAVLTAAIATLIVIWIWHRRTSSLLQVEEQNRAKRLID